MPDRRADSGDGAKDARFQDLIRLSTTLFWDAYLRGDRSAKAWLQGDDFPKAMAADGTVERKNATDQE